MFYSNLFRSRFDCNKISCDDGLVFVYLGAAYSRAEESITQLVTRLRIPFLPTAMAKGMLPDEHELCVGPARSKYSLKYTFRIARL